MSLFGSMLGDFEEDPIFGQMNSVMNSFFGGDPFGGLLGGMGGMGMQPFGRMNNALTHHNPMMSHHQSAMMPFGFPQMPRFNQMPMQSSSSFTSTSYVSMSSGPDGRPQIYQASSSTKTGPNGVMETKKTVQDSRTGVKKMAIGHHIYDRGHIIEREQNLREGTEEERQDFINLEEEEAEDFNREFLSKSAGGHRNGGPSIQCIETAPLNHSRNAIMPAIMPATGNSRKRPAEELNQEDNEETTEPIIELPESPSPPPQADEDEEEDGDRNDADNNSSRQSSSRVDIEEVDTNDSSTSSLARERSNPLGVHPRKPIRTHQASPLATNAAGHSRRSAASGAHPYNVQQSRKAQHRPMKGTVQHHSSSAYHQNPPPQYERGDN